MTLQPVPLGPASDQESSGEYRCSRCLDTSMVMREGGVVVCDCPAGEKYWKHCSRLAGVPEIWSGLRLTTYEAIPGPNSSAQWEAFTPVTEWALRVWSHLKKGRPNPGGVLLYGTRGTGKSTMAAAAANSLLRNRISIEWANVPRLYLEALKAQHTEEGLFGLVHRLSLPDVLILDDIGAEKASEYAQTLLYAVLEDRCSQGKILLATSNLDPHTRTADGTLTELESRIGERNASRLLGLCHPVSLTGEDLRQQG